MCVGHPFWRKIGPVTVDLLIHAWSMWQYVILEQPLQKFIRRNKWQCPDTPPFQVTVEPPQKNTLQRIAVPCDLSLLELADFHGNGQHSKWNLIAVNPAPVENFRLLLRSSMNIWKRRPINQETTLPTWRTISRLMLDLYFPFAPVSSNFLDGPAIGTPWNCSSCQVQVL